MAKLCSRHSYLPLTRGHNSTYLNPYESKIAASARQISTLQRQKTGCGQTRPETSNSPSYARIDSMEEIDPKKMVVQELRDALASRNLSTKGLKKDLIARLEEALDQEAFGGDDGDVAGHATAAEAAEADLDLDDDDSKDAAATNTASVKSVSSIGNQDGAGGTGATEPADQAAAAAQPEAMASASTSAAATAAPATTESGESEDVMRLLERIQRAKRFNATADLEAAEAELKRIRRAQRFGVAPKPTTTRELPAAVFMALGASKAKDGSGDRRGQKQGDRGSASKPAKRGRDGGKGGSSGRGGAGAKTTGGSHGVSAEEAERRRKRAERFGSK